MKIFISHQRKDNEFVNALTDLFEEYNIKFWVDTKQIYEKNVDIGKKIKDGFRGSTHFLLIWSSNAKDSTFVKKEVKMAISNSRVKKIFSFRIDGSKFVNEFEKFKDYPHEDINLKNIREKLINFIFLKIARETSFTSQIRIFKDKVRYDFENYRKYDSLGDNLSIKDLKKLDIKNEFVSQKGMLLKTNKEEHLLDYVTDSIRNIETSQFIPIVGDYGSGKSILCLFIMYNLCEDIKYDDLIPIYVPLRKMINYDYKDEKGLTNSIFNFINKEYKITNKQLFTNYVEKGKIIFIFDGLDEMSTTIDTSVIDNNLANIKKLIEKKNNIILTSRHTYLTRSQERKFIEDNNLIKILDFDQEQIYRFISNKINKGKIKEDIENIVTNLETIGIQKFARKPLFLQIICDNYENFANIKLANPAILFEILLNKWIIHDVNKVESLTEKKEKLTENRQRISESLAIYANKTGNTSISIDDLRNQINEEFNFEIGYHITKKDLSRFYKDAKDSTFLIKEKSENERDTFAFIHKSIIEYLVARRIVNVIKTENNPKKFESILMYTQQINSLETFEFIKYITDIEWRIQPNIYEELKHKGLADDIYNYLYSMKNWENILLETIDYAKTISKDSDPTNNPKIGNLVSILYSLSNFGKFEFKNQENNKSYNYNKLNFSNCNLANVILTNAILDNFNFSGADLTEANLINANLVSTNLSHAILKKANLSSANLKEADLSESNLENTNFSFANLEKAKFPKTILYWTDFSRANLAYADFDGATMLGTDISCANLEDANLTNIHNNINDYIRLEVPYDVDLSLSNLSNVKLNNANIPNAIIIKPASYKNLILDNTTNLKTAIIDDSGLITFIGKLTSQVPPRIQNKKELVNILQKRTCEWPFNDWYEKISNL